MLGPYKILWQREEESLRDVEVLKSDDIADFAFEFVQEQERNWVEECCKYREQHQKHREALWDIPE